MWTSYYSMSMNERKVAYAIMHCRTHWSIGRGLAGNTGQCATAKMAFTASTAMWNQQVTDYKGGSRDRIPLSPPLNLFMVNGLLENSTRG